MYNNYEVTTEALQNSRELTPNYAKSSSSLSPRSITRN